MQAGNGEGISLHCGLPAVGVGSNSKCAMALRSPREYYIVSPQCPRHFGSDARKSFVTAYTRRSCQCCSDTAEDGAWGGCASDCAMFGEAPRGRGLDRGPHAARPSSIPASRIRGNEEESRAATSGWALGANYSFAGSRWQHGQIATFEECNPRECKRYSGKGLCRTAHLGASISIKVVGEAQEKLSRCTRGQMLVMQKVHFVA